VFTEQHRVLPNITIAGDAAVAMLISRNHSESTHRLVAISKKIYGEYAKGMWMTLEKVSEFGKQFEPGFAKVIHDVLKKADLTLADIKLVLPNNTNIPCWRNLAKYLQIPFDKVYLKNIPRTAHCFNADNFINVATAIEQGELQRGDYYLLLTIGVGAVFGAAVLQY
jgi:3-oxoacyl-[acyl-carrier-protein] synthase-3